jgi:hypothetical protein
MHGSEHLPVDHRHPIQWNLPRFHPRRIHVPRIHPQSEFQARGMHGIGKILHAVRKLILALLKAAETKRPIVHAGNYRCAFVPGRIVVEDIEPHSFRQREFFQ